MLLPAYLPSLWFAMMDPKVIEHYRGDLSKINMDPQRREELLQRYAAQAEACARGAARSETEEGEKKALVAAEAGA